MWCSESALVFRFRDGEKLASIMQDTRSYLGHMKNLKRDKAYLLGWLRYQACLNLTEQGNKDIFDLNAGPIKAALLSDDKLAHRYNALYQGFLFAHMGEHQRHSELTLHIGWDAFLKAYPGGGPVPMDVFVKGISCFAAARETGNLKYRKAAHACRSIIKRWIARGHPNALHYESALDAEFEALRGRVRVARKHYEIALSIATRSGALHDVGLISERKFYNCLIKIGKHHFRHVIKHLIAYAAQTTENFLVGFGEYCLNVLNDSNEATNLVKESVASYREWGALAKVTALEEKYLSLFTMAS